MLAGAGFAADFGLEEETLVEALLVGLAFAEAFEFAEVGLAVPGFADAAEGATVPLDAAGILSNGAALTLRLFARAFSYWILEVSYCILSIGIGSAWNSV